MTIHKDEMIVDKPTVVIADSRELVRDAIADKLIDHCGVSVVARLDDGYSTIKACVRVIPDILLLDASIIRPNGIEVLERIKAQNNDIKIIILAAESDFQTAATMMSFGVVGFLPRQAKGTDYANAVHAAISGFTYWPISHIRSLSKSRRKLDRTGNVFGLSTREVEILDACVAGKSAKEVAKQLSISVRTVQTHKYSIYKKTDCRDVVGLSHIASSLQHA